MEHVNIEIKAKCRKPDSIREYLKIHQAEFKGIDHQVDTYFNAKRGRLKLREGSIENNLIYYEREDRPDAKESNFCLANVPEPKDLKEILTKSMGVKIVVAKKREIYFIQNVKFHIDEVTSLGNFVEIEASNLYRDVSREELLIQCNFYLEEFSIKKEDLITVSYSDMLAVSN